MGSPARELVPPHVLHAFGVHGPQHRLPGGQGSSVRVEHAVLKPAADDAVTAWVSDLLSALPETGFRLARPIPAADGRWVVEGWSAAALVEGDADPVGRWADLLAASRAFHSALRVVPRPAVLGSRRDRWAVADRVAWGEETVPPKDLLSPLLARLVALRRPVPRDAQLVHGDLVGNVVFADGLPPAVIDFSPYWRPVAYADAVAAVDALLWFDGGDQLLRLVQSPALPQLLVRALVFRLVDLDLRAALETDGWLQEQVPVFARVLEIVEDVVREAAGC